MIRHNQRQTDLQLMQKRMLKGSAAVVEMAMVQNDQSYSTMTKLLKMATGCETFSVLSNMKSYGKHYVFDVEALVGDPMNNNSDSEISLILNQYGMSDQHGASGNLLHRLKTGELALRRQLVMNEDYTASVPQLAYDPVEVANLQAQQAERRELERQAKEAEHREAGQPRVFNPEGYIPPKSDPEARPSSSDIGASAKAHAAKARPSTPRQPPDPPPPPRKQEEKGKSQHQDEGRGWYDKGKSHQQPFFTQGRAKGTKAKEKVPNMAKDMTKVTNHRTRAKDMETRVLEVGNGTINGLRLHYLLKKNI